MYYDVTEMYYDVTLMYYDFTEMKDAGKRQLPFYASGDN